MVCLRHFMLRGSSTFLARVEHSCKGGPAAGAPHYFRGCEVALGRKGPSANASPTLAENSPSDGLGDLVLFAACPLAACEAQGGNLPRVPLKPEECLPRWQGHPFLSPKTEEPHNSLSSYRPTAPSSLTSLCGSPPDSSRESPRVHPHL